MFLTRRARQFVGWIACVAILLGLAAPTITHALPASAAAGNWVTVCTSLGMQTLKLDAAGQVDLEAGQPDGEMGAMGSHCAFCCGSTPLMGPPPAARVEGLSPEAFAPWPRLYWAGPRFAVIWATAQPRAPPRVA